MKNVRFSIQAKFAALFIALALVLIAGIGYFAYTLNFRQVERQYLSLAASAAGMAASLVDAGRIPDYLAAGPDEGYGQTYGRLQEIKRRFGLKYLYVFVPDLDQNNVSYVFDIYAEGDDPSLVAALGDQSGAVDVYAQVLAVFLGHEPNSTAVTSGEFGWLASAYLPVFDSQGRAAAVAGVDIEMNVIIGEVREHTVQILSTAAGIIVVFTLLVLLLVRRQILFPITALSSHMEQFANAREGLSEKAFVVHTGDEIERMADSFNRMSQDIRSYARNLEAVTADRERIAAELGIAKQIQASMLPCVFPPFPDRPEFDIFATMEPAREVGGDFYDFFLLDKNRLCAVIADVSGKGVPAALFMVIAKTLIKDQAAHCSVPSEILSSVNGKLLENNDAQLFVTAFLGILELDTGRFSYSNAGHNPPLVARAGEGFEWLPVKAGLMLAGWEDFAYRTEELILSPGDRIFFYTDGVTEALSPAQELFGNDRLLAALGAHGGLPPEELVARLRRELVDFAGGAEQADDVTMMLLSYRQRAYDEQQL